MTQEVHCRGLRYTSWTVWLRMIEPSGWTLGEGVPSDLRAVKQDFSSRPQIAIFVFPNTVSKGKELKEEERMGNSWQDELTSWEKASRKDLSYSVWLAPAHRWSATVSNCKCNVCVVVFQTIPHYLARYQGFKADASKNMDAWAV